MKSYRNYVPTLCIAAIVLIAGSLAISSSELFASEACKFLYETHSTCYTYGMIIRSSKKETCSGFSQEIAAKIQAKTNDSPDKRKLTMFLQALCLNACNDAVNNRKLETFAEFETNFCHK